MTDATHKPATATPPATRRIIIGDRACSGCGFNLVGQVIEREPHYQLWITRCPECGRASPLNDYPRLGKWQGRFSAVLLIAWITLWLAHLAAAVALLGGLPAAMMDHLSSTLRNDIITDYGSHIRELVQPQIDQGVTLIELPWGDTISPQYTTPDQIGFYALYNNLNADLAQQHFAHWLKNTDPVTLAMPTFANLFNTTHRAYVVGLAFSTLAVAVLGVFFSLLTLHQRWRTRLLLAVLIGPAAAAIGLGLSALDLYSYGVDPIQELAERLLFTRFAWIPYALMLPAFALGLTLGHTAARALLRLTLPPRLRVPLGILWTADGLPPPKPR